MVVKILVVIRNLWAMPAGHQPVLRLRIPSFPVHSNITTSRFSTATDTSFGASFKWGELPCCISMLYILPLCELKTAFFLVFFYRVHPPPPIDPIPTRMQSSNSGKTFPPLEHLPAVFQDIHGGGERCSIWALDPIFSPCRRDTTASSTGASVTLKYAQT